MTTGAAHRYRWLLHVLAVLYFTMGFMVRFAWPPLIPVAAADLNISMSSAGLYMSAFYIGYVISQIPGGLLGDRFGVRLVIGISLLIEVLGTFGVGIAPSFAVGFAFRVIAGLGAGMIYSSCIRYVTTLFPAKETGLAFGLLMMAPAGVGVILPNVLMPWLSTLVSWRGAFKLMSLIVLVMGIVALIVVRDTAQKQEGTDFFLVGLSAVLKNKNLIFMAFSGFWVMWVMVCFVSWGNTYVENLGFSTHSASLVMSVYGIAGVVVSPFGGVLVQKVPSPKKMFMLLFVLLAPCVWFFGQTESFALLCALSACVGILLGLANPILPVLTATFAGKELMATAGGVTGCIFQTGAIIGPWLTGLSVDAFGSFGVAWAITALAALVGMFFLLPMGDARQ